MRVFGHVALGASIDAMPGASEIYPPLQGEGRGGNGFRLASKL